MSHHDHSGSFHEEEASFAGADFSKVALSPHRRIAAAEIGHRSTARRPIGTVPEPPRYQMIAYDLEEEIRDGYRPIGGMLPTEAELVQRFDVSRFTVREALRQLERLGLIKRRQGAGTIVVSRAPAERFTQKLQSLDHLLQYAPSHLHVAKLRKVRLTRNDARLLQTGHRETWLRADGVRRSAGTGSILCAATLWLHTPSSLFTNITLAKTVSD